MKLVALIASVLTLIASAVLVTTVAELALADCGSGTSTTHTASTSGPTQFVVDGSTSNASSGGCTHQVAHGPEGTWHTQTMCEFGGQALCHDVAQCTDGSPMILQWFTTTTGEILYEDYVCPEEAVSQPQVTSDVVLRALRRIDLPESELVVQPPGGATLVNFATNFYTEQGQFSRTVRLLGQRVDLKIWPGQFGWRFGDGRSLASASAGAPYPDLEITHEYARAGGVRPSVDTTYAAQFRVNGGVWRDVNGTVTIPGAPVRLRVRTASPVLVGYH